MIVKTNCKSQILPIQNDRVMRTFIILLITFLLFYLQSCKKQENSDTVIKGSLVFSNSKLINNLDIRLVEDSTNGIRFDPYSVHSIKKLIAVDQQGNFNERISGLNSNSNFYLLLFNDSIISDVYKVLVNKENNINIIGEQLSHLRLIIKNDSVKYKGIVITTLSNMKLQNGFMIENQIKDSVLIIPVFQNATCRIFWNLFIDNYPKYTRSEFINIEQQDTLDYKISY